MRRMRVFTLAAACCLALGTVTPAAAGLIVLSGDGNIANALDGSAGVGVDPDNQVFFTNVLGAGTTVVVQSTTGSGSNSLGLADGVINTFYDNLPGVSSSLVNGPITPATLAGADLFAIVMPDNPYDGSEVAAFAAFLGGGGRMFLLGDNSAFPAGNGFINALLAALGSSMSIVPAGVSGASPLPHPLTVGVGDLTFLAGSFVSGGTTLFVSGNTPVIAAEEVGGPIPEPGTLALLGTALAVLGWRRRAPR